MITRKYKSKYFGVSYNNGWLCHVVQFGKRRLLTVCDSEIAAARLYNEFMSGIYGKYCNLNDV